MKWFNHFDNDFRVKIILCACHKELEKTVFDFSNTLKTRVELDREVNVTFDVDVTVFQYDEVGLSEVQMTSSAQIHLHSKVCFSNFDFNFLTQTCVEFILSQSIKSKFKP